MSEGSPPPADPWPRRALLVLACAVVVGALFFGAPPRFDRTESAGQPLRFFLESLGPYTLVQLAVLAALAFLSLSVLRGGGPLGGREARRARLPLFGLLLLGVIQLVPLPHWLLSIASPFVAETYASLLPDGDASWRPLSLWPAGTVASLFTGLAIAVTSAATWVVVRRARRDGGDDGARRVVGAVLVFVLAFAALECVYGIYQTHVGDDMILGFGKVSSKGRVTGTFIASAMLAVVAGMGACAATGLSVLQVVTDRKHRWPRAFVFSTLAALCLAGAYLSLSRVGFLAAGVGALTALALCAPAVRAAGRVGLSRVLWLKLGALLVAAAVAPFLIPEFRDRMDLILDWFRGADVPPEPRFVMWASTVDLFLESPVLGTGLGSYGRAIHLTQSVDTPKELWYAHNDPLNLLADVGLLGFALAAWWVLGLLARGRRAVFGGDPRLRTLAAASVGGAVVVLVASIGDFQTQFPLVAIPFAALLTIPAALAPDDDVAPGRGDGGWLTSRRPAVVMLGAAGLASIGVVVEMATRWNHVADDLDPGATSAERLVIRAGRRLQGLKDAADPGAELDAAALELTEAVDRDPLFDEAHMLLGLTETFRGRLRDEVLPHLGRARRVSRGHAHVNLLVGRRYLDLVHTEPVKEGPPGDSALAALREAGALDPHAFSNAWDFCLSRGLSPEDMARMVPDRAHPLLTLAEHMGRLGRTEGQFDALERATRVQPRLVVAKVYLGRALLDAGGRADDARDQFVAALALDPSALHLHREIAGYYRSAGKEQDGRNAFAEAGVAWPAK